jgi:hypothetical protein
VRPLGRFYALNHFISKGVLVSEEQKKNFSEVVMKISDSFLIRLKLHQLPAYQIAQMAGVNPNWLSKAINGIDPVKPQDERIISVGRVLGLSPSECFEEEEEA